MRRTGRERKGSPWLFALVALCALTFGIGLSVGALVKVDSEVKETVKWALRKQAEAFSAELADRDRDIFELQQAYGSLRRDLYTEWAQGLNPAKTKKER